MSKTFISIFAKGCAIILFPALALFLALFLPSSLHSQIPNYVPTNGLVGYWPFNGNANDESGNGNHGTVNGATLTADRNGNANRAYSFDGVDDFIHVNNLNSNSSGFSIQIWASIEDFNFNTTAQQSLIYLGTEAGANLSQTHSIDVTIDPINYTPPFLRSNLNYDYGFCGSQNSNNQWQCITVVLHGNSQQLEYFINGQSINACSVNVNGIIIQPNDVNNFGAGWHFTNLIPKNFFKGLLDDITIYNRALTQEEITALYNGTTSTSIAGCTNNTACNYNASATHDDGSCTYPAQTYLNCAGTCINDADNDGTCDELENPTLPSYLPSNGLVGYWPFNGNANDESGNGNHGTVNGATLTSDRNGNANSAYSFDGVNDNIIIASDEILNVGTSDFSISIFFRSENLTNACLIGKRSYSLGNGYSIFLQNNALYGQLIDENSASQSPGCNFNTIENQWHHYVVTFDRDNNQLAYMDGILCDYVGILDESGNIVNETDLFIGFFQPAGADCWTGCYFFNGQLDDIAIYNRALTLEEITALYNGTTTGGGGGNGGTAGTPAPSVPQGIPYQAMIRDNSGAALVNTPVTVRFSLRQDAIDGAVEYQETHNLNTNTFGLVNTHFGSGTATQGTFANINWSNTTKFIQVEANTGAGYVDMGTQQMMSVPFALKANSANEANKVKNAGLPVFANNAAALAGGLVAGEMYRTATGDLKIVY